MPSSFVARKLAHCAALFTALSGAAVAAGDCIALHALRDLNIEIRHRLQAQDDDKRFVLPRERAWFKAFDHVGAVSIKAKFTKGAWRKSGSGTLISACHVLTSYHVVFPDFAPFDPHRKVMFSFGVSSASGSPFKYAIEGTPVDIGLFDPRRPVHLLDQIVVRLKERAPAEYHGLDFAAVDPNDFGADVYACGYPGELNVFADDPRALYCDKCQVKGYHYLRGYETNCTMPAGTSGGAVFRLLKDAACDPALKLALVGAPNQSPGAELFPKNHPRIRSFVTDYQRTLAAIRGSIAQDDCSTLTLARARHPSAYGYR